MKFRKVIRKRIRHEKDGVNVAGDVNATIAANVNEPGSRTKTSSRSRQRIVQRSGRRDDEQDERR
jgi:hypothetical protein